MDMLQPGRVAQAAGLLCSCASGSGFRVWSLALGFGIRALGFGTQSLACSCMWLLPLLLGMWWTLVML